MVMICVANEPDACQASTYIGAVWGGFDFLKKGEPEPEQAELIFELYLLHFLQTKSIYNSQFIKADL